MNPPRGGAVAYAPFPDPDRRPFYPIYSPTTDRDVLVVLLSPDLVGVFVHYYNHRTRPCLGNKEACEGCDLRYDKRWKGFAAAWDKDKGRLCLVQVTQEAFLRTPAFHHNKGSLRGMVLRMTRAGASKNARVTATLKPATWADGVLPPAFDVKAALERVWFTAPREAENPGEEGGGHDSPK